MKQKFLLLTALVAINLTAMAATKNAIQRIDPTDWYVGMKNPSLQLMVYARASGDVHVTTDYPGASSQRRPRLAQLPAPLPEHKGRPAWHDDAEVLRRKQDKTIVHYQLKEREMDGAERQGFSNADVLYMLMPDRFAQGKDHPTHIDGMQNYVEDRSQPSLRHGGDLKGIMDHLDYFNELGVTALWFTPVLENNSPDDNGFSTYHGYATTDYYRVDPRFGTNEQYRQLIDAAHKNNLKVVMDMIFNHCGFEHPWVADMPSKDWLNQSDPQAPATSAAPAEGSLQVGPPTPATS